MSNEKFGSALSKSGKGWPEMVNERERLLGDGREIIIASRIQLNRFAARFAAAEHAQRAVKDARLLIERMDDWLEKTRLNR